MRKALSALGIAVSAVVPVAVPSSLEAMMIVPCANRESVEVMQNPDYPHFSAPRSRRVERGDTLWEISEREYGTPWAYGALAIINHIKDPDKISVGQVLKVPTQPRPIETLYREGGMNLCPIIGQSDSFPRQVTIGTKEYCNLLGPDCIVDNYGFCAPTRGGNCEGHPVLYKL